MHDNCMFSNTTLTYNKMMVEIGTGMHIDDRNLHISDDMWIVVCVNDV